MSGKLAWYLGGAIAAWVTFTVQGFFVYLCLLVYALSVDGDVGGPLAAPFMVLLAALLATALVPLLYVPVVLCLETVLKRVGLPGRMLLIVAAVAVLAAGVVTIFALLAEVSAGGALIAWLVLLFLLVLPTLASIVVVRGRKLTGMLKHGPSNGGYRSH